MSAGTSSYSPVHRTLTFSGHITEQVLGRPGRKLCYYRVGYCPVVVEGDFAKATTLLYPGYGGTPEYGLIVRSGLGREERRTLLDTASGMSRDVLERTGDFSLTKWFHDNGVPQVIETDEDFFYHRSPKTEDGLPPPGRESVNDRFGRADGAVHCDINPKNRRGGPS
jgi:hypothetical protein